MRTFEIGDRVRFNFPPYLGDSDLGTIVKIDDSKTNCNFVVDWDDDILKIE